MKNLVLFSCLLSVSASSDDLIHFSDCPSDVKTNIAQHVAECLKESDLWLGSLGTFEGGETAILDRVQCEILDVFPVRWICCLSTANDDLNDLPANADVYIYPPPQKPAIIYSHAGIAFRRTELGELIPVDEVDRIHLEPVYRAPVWDGPESLYLLLTSKVGQLDFERVPHGCPSGPHGRITAFLDEVRSVETNGVVNDNGLRQVLSNRLFRIDFGNAFRIDSLARNGVAFHSSVSKFDSPERPFPSTMQTAFVALTQRELSELAFIANRIHHQEDPSYFGSVVANNPEIILDIPDITTEFGLLVESSTGKSSGNNLDNSPPTGFENHAAHPIQNQRDRFRAFSIAKKRTTGLEIHGIEFAVFSNILASSQLHGTPGETLSFCRKISECILQIPSQSTYQPGAGVEEAKCDLLLQCLAACRSRDRLRTAPLCKAVWLFSRREKAFLEGRPSWNGRTPAGGPENGTARLPTNEDRDRVMKKLQRLDFELSEFAKQVRENDVNDSKEETP